MCKNFLLKFLAISEKSAKRIKGATFCRTLISLLSYNASRLQLYRLSHAAVN